MSTQTLSQVIAQPTMQAGKAPAQTGGMGALMPQSFEEAMKFADIMSGSNIIPKDYQGKPGNILVAIQWGSELGLPPLQAMQNIAVINGRPSIWGDAMLALVQGSGLLEYIKEDPQADGCVCVLKRKGQPEISREFTKDDAKQAGLLSKQGPWSQYPKRMMQLRARAFALRDAFADVLRGVHIAEEAQDMPKEMRDVTPQQEAPKAANKADTVASKVASKRGKKSEPKEAGPDLGAMINAMNAATTEAELGQAAKDASKLDNGDRDKARAHYRDRLLEIRDAEAAKNEQDGADDPGADAPSIEETITRDLNYVTGPDVQDVLSTYEAQLNAMEEGDPDAYGRIMDLAEKQAAA